MLNAFELRIPTVSLQAIALIVMLHQRWRSRAWGVATELMHDDPADAAKPTHRHNSHVFMYFNSALIVICGLLLCSSSVALAYMNHTTGDISGLPHLGQAIAFDTAICLLISCVVVFEYRLWEGFSGIHVFPMSHMYIDFT
jgi:hypothetical protein